MSMLYRRFRGASPACPTPRNREIGFVSSSFSFRACRACRACGRGEAARAHVERHSSRWASRVLVSTCSGPLGGDLLCAGAWVLSVSAPKTEPVVRLLCAGTWVLIGSTFWRCNFPAQARGFFQVFCMLCVCFLVKSLSIASTFGLAGLLAVIFCAQARGF